MVKSNPTSEPVDPWLLVHRLEVVHTTAIDLLPDFTEQLLEVLAALEAPEA